MIKFPFPNNQEQGYTLFEILLVLILLSSILLLSIPSFTTSIRVNDINYFFEQLEKDLYEGQMRAMTDGIIVRFVFSPTNNNYIIRHGVNAVETRDFPKGLTVVKGTLDYNGIRFLPTGTTSNSGSLLFYYGADRYDLVFQFVRGRFYIAKR
ncbi:competence type IV pilus minor pilin ComGD [Evansella sp. AB-P1]|uniref:competence type IV pilus minor pilin ComGD n=1 Tax=Evansella sp. AB-P1 TaxID=3037653 RepID=UPI00241E750C|nr:competence type IV pilus minor pilin ComGD [Evansella sp. AB-P1]MDG5788724.1 competence type IV pilus minor pilin ComGD [Evansella sp. AB-P1]